MASAGSSANANAAQRFWDYFHTQKRLIDEKSLQNEDVGQMVRDLDSALREALVYLPPYDQKQLSKDLDSLRLAIQQKGRRDADGQTKGGTVMAGARSGFRFRSAQSKSSTTTTTSNHPTKKTGHDDDVLSAENSKPSENNPKPSNNATTGSASALSLASVTNEWKTVTMPHQPGSTAAPGSVDQSDCELRDISNSIIDLRQSSNAIRALNCHRLNNSIVVCGPFAGSATVRDSVNCILVLAVRQMRLENSFSIDVYLHCSSRPIIEKSSGIRFAPYPAVSSLSHQHSSLSAGAGELLALPNMFDAVDDFNWLRRQHSPNWSINPSPLTNTAWSELGTRADDAESSTISKDELLAFLPQSQ
ncbi:hypothetical protein H4217_001326 [Coemansia sp. RSA 1939]|nr:hypothetical protein H4217_001326 [Coemansia sp. RSA 1939]KAJ2616641.1 hypothetical protein EV177_000947 [Coemansia sp. RSA 1804]KAJ2683328.1 hypothetical protein GGH99_004403 [Coemansia sp. RSA 1285]